MKANPGGQVAPNEVVGRDTLIASLWDILERQSAILSAERRMGKTSIIKKMEAEPPENKLPIFRDLEHVGSPLEFVEAVLQDVEEYLSKKQKVANRTRQLLQDLRGLEVKGFKLPQEIASDWKKILKAVIDDLVTNQERQVILLWDEVPYMLDKIGNVAAIEVLDTLRSLRQTYPDVRMVFTGSIGLHHVVNELKQKGYANEPTNDMYPVDVPPLSEEDATALASELLEGEKIPTANLQEVAAAIARSVSCIPFYIHHLIARLKMRNDTVEPTTVLEVVGDCLLDPLNPWKMEHYRDRITNYYDSDRQAYALNLLDILSNAERALSFDDLFASLRLEPQTQDREIAKDVLRLLGKDYYIVRQKDLKYSFRYPLIQRYWQFLRG
ncbi:hypothetical protein [Pseudanabaena sp. PCC 6802]|uniref:hypothetical protein n=1 Tax=Pseudanabaena sp. PCC 6802 TaxID=118173 RepID=UPI0003492321|nr:hypothetical protein [Pseudanabaena sp. PCC 6802]